MSTVRRPNSGGKLTDVEQIRQALTKFNFAVDERRFEDFINLFTDDGVIIREYGRYESRAAILKLLEEGELARNPKLQRKHTNLNVLIDIDGTEARVDCDLVEYDRYG